MNTKTITDEDFIHSQEYQEFISSNPGRGNLKIRAYAASEALPVSGLQIIVSTKIGGDKVIFFDGVTDASGMIQTLSLPAPKLGINNLVIPITTTYDIEAIYSGSTDIELFHVNMYDGICVVQNINFIPGGTNGN